MMKYLFFLSLLTLVACGGKKDPSDQNKIKNSPKNSITASVEVVAQISEDTIVSKKAAYKKRNETLALEGVGTVAVGCEARIEKGEVSYRVSGDQLVSSSISGIEEGPIQRIKGNRGKIYGTWFRGLTVEGNIVREFYLEIKENRLIAKTVCKLSR